ncbi:MAG: asparagine synthase-related protein [Bradymonadaceae bacterium]
MADFFARQTLICSGKSAKPLLGHRRGGKDAGSGGAAVVFRPGPVPFDGGQYSDDDLVMAWTGHLRDYGGLAAELGVKPRPEEVIPAAWQRFGAEALNEFKGVVAGVVWDGRDRTWRVFRDRLGLVPIYFFPWGDELLVSTDADWILSVLPERPAVNRRRMAAFLMGSMDRGRDDFVEGMKRLRPGEMATWQKGSPPTFTSHWLPPAGRISGVEASGKILELLGHLLEDVNDSSTIVSMSGGLDSPVLAALLARIRGSDRDHPLVVGSMLMPRMARGDERDAIVRLTRSLPLEVHAFAADSHWPLQDLDILVDQPGAGPHFHPEEVYVLPYHRFLESRLGPIRMVYGNGADDVLWCPGGIYRRRLAAHGSTAEMARQPTVPMARAIVGHWLRKSALNDYVQPWRATRGSAPGHDALPWRHPRGWVQAVDGWRGVTQWTSPTATWREQRLLRLQTWKWELVCRTLNREARRSQTPAIFPMLDSAFWDLCLQVEPLELAEGGRQKAVLRRAARSLLPDSVLRRQKHGGFDALVEYGLAHREATRVRHLFSSSSLARAGLIDGKKFLNAFEAYQGSDAYALGRPYLGSMSVWHTVAAEVWLSRW